MDTRADEQEGERGAGIADPERRIGRLVVARQHQEREGHDREAAELQHRALPDVGNAAPAKGGFVDVGAVADQRAERREQERQGNHDAHQRGGHVQFDDHHPVERAHEQDQRHPDGDLEQRQAQKAGQRQIIRRDIREGHVAGADPSDLAKREVTGAEHGRGRSPLAVFRAGAGV
jgi:hypothetical protein